MSAPFLITGLPRSRTAWMSALTTTAQTVCRHAAMAQIDELEDLRALWRSDAHDYVGVSDPAIGFSMDWVMREIAPRTLIIDRAVDQVEQSLARAGLPATNYCGLLLEALAPWRAHPLAMCVPFDDLSDAEVMQRAWAHLMPVQPFDRERFEHLARLNIQNDQYLKREVDPARVAAVRRLMQTVAPRVAVKAEGVTMAQIKAIQLEAAKLPQLELETRHFFSNGMYCRQMTLPKDALIVGKKHRHDHFFMVMSGKLAVSDVTGRRVLSTGDVLVAPAGVKRVLFAVETTTAINVHRTDKTDLDEIETELIEPEADALFDARNKLKRGELTCS